jgi:hypothetical protein
MDKRRILLTVDKDGTTVAGGERIGELQAEQRERLIGSENDAPERTGTTLVLAIDNRRIANSAIKINRQRGDTGAVELHENVGVLVAAKGVARQPNRHILTTGHLSSIQCIYCINSLTICVCVRGRKLSFFFFFFFFFFFVGLWFVAQNGLARSGVRQTTWLRHRNRCTAIDPNSARLADHAIQQRGDNCHANKKHSLRETASFARCVRSN